MIAHAIEYMAEALRTIPLQKTVALSATLEAFDGAAMAAVKLHAEAPEGDLAAKGSAAASAARVAKGASRDSSGRGIVDALTSAFAGGDEGGGNNITLVLNGREFGRAVDVHLAKKHNLSIG